MWLKTDCEKLKTFRIVVVVFLCSIVLSIKADDTAFHETNTIKFRINIEKNDRCKNILPPISVKEGSSIRVEIVVRNITLTENSRCSIVKNKHEIIPIVYPKDFIFQPSNNRNETLATIKNVTKSMEGTWKCSFLLENTKQQKTINIECRTDVTVEAKEQEKTNINMWIYIGVGVALVVIIIIAQTICILYFKSKANSARRLTRLEINETLSRDDPMRYSTCPGERVKKRKGESCIYETVGVQARPPLPLPGEENEQIYEDENTQQCTHAPAPPSLASLPRKPKLQSKKEVDKLPPVLSSPKPQGHINKQKPVKKSKIPPPITQKPQKTGCALIAQELNNAFKNRIDDGAPLIAPKPSITKPLLDPKSPEPTKKSPMPKKPAQEKTCPLKTSPFMENSPPSMAKPPSVARLLQNLPPGVAKLPQHLQPPASKPSVAKLTQNLPPPVVLPQNSSSPRPFVARFQQSTPPVVRVPPMERALNIPPSSFENGLRSAAVPNNKPAPAPSMKKPPLPTPVEQEEMYEPVADVDSDDEWTYEQLPQYNIYNI